MARERPNCIASFYLGARRYALESLASIQVNLLFKNGDLLELYAENKQAEMAADASLTFFQLFNK
ncbi:MAG TPA: hypothetical protein VEG44_04820 [Candidatus Acidoferrales bacterium]|nr:hypothetical protein [Candidatus Acidoferrales bacterium]